MKQGNFRQLLGSFFAAIVFYTILPLPLDWQLNWERIARWTPCIGLFLGGLLGLVDWGLALIDIPILTRSALIVALWVMFTGGLHLDGAMDTADGLAVVEPQRRLEVMGDSVTGAFGAIAAVVLLLLKTVALSDLESYRWLALMATAGWGRWGQVVAIASYPYLKPTGKGAFHKQTIRPLADVSFGLLFLLGLSLLLWITKQEKLAVGIILSGGAIALLTGFYFYRQLGGHTGDTYGAVVEWTEAIFLCLLTGFCP